MSNNLERVAIHGKSYRFVVCALLLLGCRVVAQTSGEKGSAWMFEARYGSAEYVSAASTLFLTPFQPGRYVEFSFLPNEAPEFGVSFELFRDSSQRYLAGVALQPNFTTLDVSDSSFRSFRSGEYPLATLRIFQLRFAFQGIWYNALPFSLGVGILRGAIGVSYAWGSSVNVLNQAKAFPGIQSIAPHAAWMLSLDGGIGYRVPGSPLSMTANVTENFRLKFLSGSNFLDIAMTPSSSYTFSSSEISPVYFSLGVLFDL